MLKTPVPSCLTFRNESVYLWPIYVFSRNHCVWAWEPQRSWNFISKLSENCLLYFANKQQRSLAVCLSIFFSNINIKMCNKPKEGGWNTYYKHILYMFMKTDRVNTFVHLSDPLQRNIFSYFITWVFWWLINKPVQYNLCAD